MLMLPLLRVLLSPLDGTLALWSLELQFFPLGLVQAVQVVQPDLAVQAVQVVQPDLAVQAIQVVLHMSRKEMRKVFVGVQDLEGESAPFPLLSKWLEALLI